MADALSLLQTLFTTNSVADEIADTKDLTKFQKDQKSFEQEKTSFFRDSDTQLHNQVAKNLLPKIFVAYHRQISDKFRTKCISLIQGVLNVIPESILKESFDPSKFSQFLHTILRH